jgi:hypothetical protein
MSLALRIVRRLASFTPVPNTAKNVIAVLLSPRAALQLLRLTAACHAQAIPLKLVVGRAD